MLLRRLISTCSALLLGSVCLNACGPSAVEPETFERVFVAVEGRGQVAVLDAFSGRLLERVDLTARSGHGFSTFAPHNVQGDTQGRIVWTTAPPHLIDHTHDGDAHGNASGPEELIGIDAQTFEIRERIEVGVGTHIAHVVLFGGNYAAVSAYAKDALLVVDLAARRVERVIALPPGTGPHGVRITPDHRSLVVAGMKTGGLLLVDLVTNAIDTLPLPGHAVQTAVSPDGSFAFASIYDTKQIARVDLATRELALWPLPEGSAGPVQIYPTPDGKHLWIADQGALNGDPIGTQLLRMDVSTGKVDLIAPVGRGPHGVVVSRDGRRVWTTLLVDGSIQAIDTSSGQVQTTTQIGKNPNGVSYVFTGGAMP